MKKHPRFSHSIPAAAKRNLRFSYETLKVLEQDLLAQAASGCPTGESVGSNPDVSKGAC